MEVKCGGAVEKETKMLPVADLQSMYLKMMKKMRMMKTGIKSILKEHKNASVVRR